MAAPTERQYVLRALCPGDVPVWDTGDPERGLCEGINPRLGQFPVPVQATTAPLFGVRAPVPCDRWSVWIVDLVSGAGLAAPTTVVFEVALGMDWNLTTLTPARTWTPPVGFPASQFLFSVSARSANQFLLRARVPPGVGAGVVRGSWRVVAERANAFATAPVWDLGPGVV